ncbi:hypothetical protein GPECTOR_4g902 [Gonium pectorale]|uniref:Uncharacterized protein n=1 Tax=Gonium pectorale TaxID=33097 RepID=A0A150GYC3_GONPE|nr:hypothetical protein GPECTOR_4g902 [Gonium pectorale]|eukprot:KXZ54831.1 hypothetical protein GPECTOR_4g902 [Gonium pectorale]
MALNGGAALAGGDDEADEGEGEGEDGDGEDDEGAGPGPSEAAPDINRAAKDLVTLTGIPLETAMNALKETHEAVYGGAAVSSVGAAAAGALHNAWLEEAQMWLAVNLELQEEIKDVGLAMQESLQEYEAAKAADDVPLSERPPDFLRDRFAPPHGSAAAVAGAPRSAVFAKLADFACHRELFAAAPAAAHAGSGAADGAAAAGGAGPGSHKASLVKLLELECKCRKWYPGKGTSRFFEQLAADCVTAAVAAAPEAATLAQSGWLGCAEGPGACSTCAAALGSSQAADAGAAAGPSTSAGAAPAAAPARVRLQPDAAAAVLAAVGGLTERRANEVQTEVCKMPTTSGQVPDVFAALAEPGDEDAAGSDADDIVVLEAGPSHGAAGARDQQAVEI